MVDIVTRLGKGSPLTNAEVDANFTNLAEVSGVTGEPMGHEDRTTSTISFNASTRTFTIAPTASSFTVWCKGKKVVVSSARTVTIPNTTGMYSIYFDSTGTLAAKSGYFTFAEEAPTAYIYWNATTGTAPYFGDERHGVVLDWQTHEYLHRTRGAALASGFSASGYVLGGNGSSNSHAQITLEGGTFFDEDMKIIVTATNTPTAGTWEQDLVSPARIPVLYLSGTGWVIDSPTDYPLKQGTARPQYNAFSGGVWSTADVANNKYATSWILATNNLTYPVIAIIGQAESDLQSAAEAVDFTELQLPGFPSVEFRPLYKLIFQCADSCTNAVHASLVSITDIRSIAAAGTAASIVTDHGNLSGLSDDDHPQYLSVDTVRGSLTAAVKASFLPSQTSNAGKFLQTDGTATSWQALTSGNVTTALGFTPYNATNPSGYISGITSGMVTTALGFTPYNATNPSGYVTAAGARGSISVTGAGSYDSATGVINIVGGVTSFNTRTGAITLSSSDVTTALGFTPYNSTNPNGYLTGITSTQVTTALGYTPYNSSNPSGYITGITSGMVTTALGFTPYNNSNPSGYITSAALSPYLTTASAASAYLALSGDATRSGTTTLSGVTVFNNYISLGGDFYHNGNQYILNPAQNGWINIVNRNGGSPFINNVTYNGSTILHAGNYNSYALPLSGGTMTGTLGLHSTTGTNGFYNGTGDGANFSTYNFLLRGWNGMAFENPTVGGAYPNQVSGVVDFRNGIINMKGGFQANGSTVLHAGNYNSYAPTLTGGGASGTWGINITGNAGTASKVTRKEVAGYLWDGSTLSTYWTKIGRVSGDASMMVSIYGSTDSNYSGAQLALATFKSFSGGSVSAQLDSLTANSLNANIAIDNSGDCWIYISAAWSSFVRYSIDEQYNCTIYSSPTQQITTPANSKVLGPGQGVRATSGNVTGASVYNTGSIVGDLTVRGSVSIASNTALHAGNYSSYALPLSGGTATGQIISSANGNQLRFVRADGTTPDWTFHGWSGGLNIFSSTVSTVYIGRDGPGTSLDVYNGSLTQAGNQVLHAGNYTSYSPSLTGSGASGTWAIKSRSINAVRTSNTNFNDLSTALDTFTAGTNYIPSGGAYNQPADGDHHYLAWGGIEGSAVWAAQIDVNFYDDRVWFRRQYGSSWQAWRQFIHDGNYNSYSPTLTGGNASGTWAINITGSAATATDNTKLPLTGGSLSGALNVSRRRLSFSSSYNDANHSLYNNYENIDGEGVWDGMKMNVYAGLRVRVGNAGGAVPSLSFAIYDGQGVHIPGSFTMGSRANASTYGGNTSGMSGHAFPAEVRASGAKPTLTWHYESVATRHIALDADGALNVYNPGESGGAVFKVGGDTALHAGNYSSYALPLSGGTVTGTATFSRTDDNAISVGTIRGRAVGSQSGDFVHIYERVHIGSPAGWGSRSAPAYGLSTYGGCALATDTGSVTIGGNAALHAGNYTSYVNAKGGSWYGSGLPGSRWGGYSVSGGEISFGDGLPNAGQMGILVDGCYVAGENNGFWSMASDNTWGSRRGMYWDGSYLNFTTNTPTARFQGILSDGRANIFDEVIKQYLYVRHIEGKDWDTYSTGASGLYLNYSSNQSVFIGSSAHTALHAGNYNSYAPTLTGGNASGSWGISITGAAASAGSANVMPSTGYGNGTFTWRQESGTFAGQSGWASYLISNHGDGNTYYSQTIIMPFWSAPQYSRKQGSSAVVGPYVFITTENYTSYTVPVGGGTFTGSITSNGNVTAYSDERKKTNWRGFAEDFIEQLATVKSGTYDRTDMTLTQDGVSAQSLQQVMPNSVFADEHGMLSVNYGGAALASAVELAKDNVELRARIERLESLINKLIGD